MQFENKQTDYNADSKSNQMSIKNSLSIVSDQISKIGKQLITHSKDLSKLQEDIQKKETKENFFNLKIRFDLFSDLENIKNLNEKFLPKIEAIY